MSRMSSPGMYWRCSAKSSERPKNGEWWRPLMNPSTTVRDSRSRLAMRARVDGSRNRVSDWPVALPYTRARLIASHLGARQRRGLEQVLDHVVRRHPLRFGVEVGEDAMAQHRVRQRPDVLEADVV